MDKRKQLELTTFQQRVVGYLGERGGECHQDEVAYAVGVNRGSMGPCVRHLETKGLLDVSRDQYPRTLRLTGAGRGWLKQDAR